jgi:hypothetical protein
VAGASRQLECVIVEANSLGVIMHHLQLGTFTHFFQFWRLEIQDHSIGMVSFS